MLGKASVYQISERFDSKLADVQNSLVTLLGRQLRWPIVDPGPLNSESGIDNFSWLSPKGGHVNALNRAQLALFDYPKLGFSVFSPEL